MYVAHTCPCGQTPPGTHFLHLDFDRYMDFPGWRCRVAGMIGRWPREKSIMFCYILFLYSGAVPIPVLFTKRPVIRYRISIHRSKGKVIVDTRGGVLIPP